MIGVDTNILVYAHRKDSQFYKSAFSKLKELAESGFDWTIPWPCVHEFLAVVTHPKIYRPPTTNSDAVRQLELWMESPTLQLGAEGSHYWRRLRTFALLGTVKGPMFHDARIAAICLELGVSVLWTADRDYSSLPGLRIENPLRK